MREGGSVPAERVAYGWKLVLGRAPKQRENDALLRAYERFLMRFGADLHAAAAYLKQGEAPRDPSLPVAELAASSAVANLILNLDEAVTKE